jgi:hypothetical protein
MDDHDKLRAAAKRAIMGKPRDELFFALLCVIDRAPSMVLTALEEAAEWAASAGELRDDVGCPGGSARDGRTGMIDAEPIGLNCPGCGEPPRFLIAPNQAFCGNDSCRMLMWDPAKTVAEMIAEGINEIDLRGLQ